MSQNDEAINSNELILSSPHPGALANIPPEAELAAVRQMMETLLARMELLQQNQAIQLAGVHDRLDAVELELPLIQEQGALRMRDLETRLSVEIDQATAAVTAAVQEEVADKFSALAAQMEAQRGELRQMRESKMAADVRLNRAILDIERLCGNLALRTEHEPLRTNETAASPFRSRISEHIRKAAIEMAPGGGNPLTGDSQPKRAEVAPVTPVSPSSTNGTPAQRTPIAEATVPATPVIKAVAPGNVVPGFDAWKRQFMQDGEPSMPALSSGTGKSDEPVICPRCCSDRTRPATLNRWDRVLRLANFVPHRCRSCSHRFYRRGVAHPAALEDEQPGTPTPDAMETR